MGVFLSLLIVTLMSFALTYGRFSDELSSSSNDYGSDIEYVVSDTVEVSNVDEFIGAIENGYSNIQISDDAMDPLVITVGMTDVGVDLTLDLNGHCIIRNSRDPMLNVESGVRLTIIDSKGGGSFYNPVGSVLRVSGGTLTVTSGVFESGPRKGEYRNGNTSQSGGTINGTQSVTVHVKQENPDGTYSYVPRPQTMPTIEPAEPTAATGNLLNGNMYFEQAYDPFILADTFLYYTHLDNQEDTVQISKNAGSADFYYDYMDGGQRIGIFGYHKTKATASAMKTQGYPFSIVSMYSGSMYARGGEYYSYFGSADTYGIYAEGGYMAVENGKFEVIEGGTSILCAYTEGTDDTQEYLRISDGDFFCDYGDAIQVNGGNLVLTGGSFTKNATSAPQGSNNSAIIRVEDGVLRDTATQSHIDFTVSGNNVYGIYVEKNGDPLEVTEATADVLLRGATFEFEAGSNNSAIYAKGSTIGLTDCTFTMDGTAASGSGNSGLTTENSNLDLVRCSFIIPGTDARGVDIREGDVDFNECVFTVNGSNSSGIAVTKGELVYNGGTVAVTGAHASGLSVSNGTVDISGVKITSDGDNASGIAVTDGRLEYTDGTVSVTGSLASGLSVKGEVEVSGITLTSDGLGIEVSDGTSTQGTLTVTKASLTENSRSLDLNTKGVAILVTGGDLTLQEGTTTNITSTITTANEAEWGTSDSVYVSGGSLQSLGTLNITHTGLASTSSESGGTESSPSVSTIYQTFEIRSFAVRVEAPESGSSAVVLRSGNITNSVGGGVKVSSANAAASVDVMLGAEGSSLAPTVQTTGTTMLSGWYTPYRGAARNWQYQLTRDGGHAVEVSGGTLTIYGGSYSTQQGEGILVKDGTANVYGGSFRGKDSYKTQGDAAGATASYAFKMYGGTANIYGGTFGNLYENGSSAFIMGKSEENRGTANIYGGTFEVGGQSGFSLYDYANVLFDPNGRETGKNQGSEITVHGLACAIAVESSERRVDLTIHGGTFTSTNISTTYDGIWYSNPNCVLTITGGTFNGGGRSGLYFEKQPNNKQVGGVTLSNAQISGGTFIGSQSGIGGYFSESAILADGYMFNKTNNRTTWTCVANN